MEFLSELFKKFNDFDEKVDNLIESQLKKLSPFDKIEKTTPMDTQPFNEEE